MSCIKSSNKLGWLRSFSARFLRKSTCSTSLYKHIRTQIYVSFNLFYLRNSIIGSRWQPDSLNSSTNVILLKKVPISPPLLIRAFINFGSRRATRSFFFFFFFFLPFWKINTKNGRFFRWRTNVYGPSNLTCTNTIDPFYKTQCEIG